MIKKTRRCWRCNTWLTRNKEGELVYREVELIGMAGNPKVKVHVSCEAGTKESLRKLTARPWGA